MRASKRTLGLAATLLMLTALALASGGCVETQTPGVVSCETSSDCVEPGQPGGMVCLENVCANCGADNECEADYGVGALCIDGACQPCERGRTGCGCLDGDRCLEGPGCSDGVCESCEDGRRHCACRAGDDACDEGLFCDDLDMCVPVVCEDGEAGAPGEEGCPCDADDSCAEENLACSDDGICIDCPIDVEGCPCREEACGGDMICDDETSTCRPPSSCVDFGCGANQLCDTGIESAVSCLEECEEGYFWDGATSTCYPISARSCTPGGAFSLFEICREQNRRCVATDDTAICDECLPGHVPDAGGEACRALITCSDLDCSSQNRLCQTESVTEDASCGDCRGGFRLEGTICVTVPTATCSADPTDPLSILMDCEAEHRTCIESGSSAACGDCQAPDYLFDPDRDACVPFLDCEGFVQCDGEQRACVDTDPLTGAPVYPSCGDCLDGYVDIGEGACVGENGCEETLVCPEGLTCIQPTPFSEARCEAPRCPLPEAPGEAGSAWYPNHHLGARCVTCPPCDDPGSTGFPWPVTTFDGVCVCETEPGFYFDDRATEVKVTACDQDGDGWTRRSAHPYVNEPEDLALFLNARCDVRSIDRFVLQNEYRQRIEIPVTDLGLPADTDHLDLYETVRNDDPQRLAEPRQATPMYGERLPRAAELNPLTRACVSEQADYNDNFISDLREGDDSEIDPPDGQPGEWMEAFKQLSYFLELHTAWFEEILPGEPGYDPNSDDGRYVIAERSRCDLDFALGYDDFDSDYWRSCTRRRRADFSEDTHTTYDFARWSCGEREESCPQLSPLVTGPDIQGAIQDHGLCDLPESELPPTDGIWRGMNHHSQFRCVQVLESSSKELEPWQLLEQDLWLERGDQTGYHLNLCSLTSCDPEDAECVSSRPLGPADPNPADPAMACASDADSLAALDPELDLGVFWVARRFADYTASDNDYAEGCIDEGIEWPHLCPGYDANPDAVVVDGNPGAFGQVICGCGYNYGGPECDLGCPGSYDPNVNVINQVHWGGRYDSELDPAYASCLGGYCPVLPDGVGGGRRGFWLCGDTSATTPTEAPCSGNESCGADQACIEGACVDPCQADTDCAGGETCDGAGTGPRGNPLGVCLPRFRLRGEVPAVGIHREVLVEGSGTACDEETVCESIDETCIDGVCVSAATVGESCSNEAPCPAGSSCIGGFCRSGFTLR